MGRIAGVYGVSGWIKVNSYTRPRENILSYKPWYLQKDGKCTIVHLRAGRRSGKTLIANLRGIDDRESARSLVDADISIERRQLPELEEGEYYWCDLVGMAVTNRNGIALGIVKEILETGANDVLVIEGEKKILVPLTMGTHVIDVDLEQGKMQVDWEPEDA